MNNDKEKISKMILSYLRGNPEAGDTLEEITKWWLELERIELSVDEVGNVLESLVQRGVIKKQKVKDGPTFYKIHHE